MSDDMIARLGRVDLFAGLSKRALRRIADSGREVTHAPGHEVAAEGLGGHALHLILEGTAHVTVGGAARPDLGPGEYFGEISVIDGKPRSATVTAGPQGLRALAIPGVGFRATLAKEPEMAQALLVNLCARIRRIETAA
jgi:CRP-like cAMP-binding protein